MQDNQLLDFGNMTAGNYLNVFKGKDSLRKFCNPDCAPPLPLY